MLNTTVIPAPRVPLVDPETGIISNEWYRYLFNLFTLTGAGGNAVSLDDLQIGPPVQEATGGGGGGGSVNSVTGTTPIASTGGVNPDISISQATTSTNGYLSSTDWNTFNGKGSGTVTSVDLTASTGISVSGGPITGSGSITVTNTAPDQTVALASGTGISVTGTYPSFTVTNTAPSSGGTVTSVTGTSPVASSGGTTPAISLASGYGDTLNPYASKTANYVLASPDGLAGVPTFRAVVANDIPTLNQNTTGSAATLTTGRTIAITGDLAYTSPSFNGSTNVTAAGTLATVNANVGAFTNASLTVNAKGLITAASSGTAPVTSVTGTAPIVSSGGATPAISLAASYGDTQNPYASKTANFILAAPNGSAGVPTFRAVVAADIPTLNQNTTGTASNVTGTVAIANGGTGETTRQAAIDALAGAVTSGQYLRGNGTDVVMSAIQAADVPTLNQNTTGTAANVTGTVAIVNGGTGQTTATNAFNALSPLTTLGDILYEETGSVAARLPIGTTSQVLTVVSGKPAWAAAAAGGSNITTLGMWENNRTISSNYTVGTGNSSMSSGPITINSGVVVTIPSGSRWVVL